MHDLEFGFTPGVHAALVCILYLMTCFLLAPMPRYSTCSHALCSLLFWALSCYNTGKIPYFLKSACKAAKLHGNILPDSRTLQRCAATTQLKDVFSGDSGEKQLCGNPEPAATQEVMPRSSLLLPDGTLMEWLMPAGAQLPRSLLPPPEKPQTKS